MFALCLLCFLLCHLSLKLLKVNMCLCLTSVYSPDSLTLWGFCSLSHHSKLGEDNVEWEGNLGDTLALSKLFGIYLIWLFVFFITSECHVIFGEKGFRTILGMSESIVYPNFCCFVYRIQ